MASSYHDRFAYDPRKTECYMSPCSPTSHDRLAIQSLRSVSEQSLSPTLLEPSQSDTSELHNTLLGKSPDDIKKTTRSSRTRWNTFRQWAIDLWFWEITLLFLSMAALGAQIGVLWSYSGRSLPDWPSGLTINALVSLLSAISTSALLSVVSTIIGQNKWIWLSRDGSRLSHLELIDDASRGPWGSLIYVASSRKLNVITLASVITICSLLTAPFVQQVVQIDYMTVTVGNTSIQDRVLYHGSLSDDGGFYSDIPETMLAGYAQGLSFTRDLSDPLSKAYLQLTPNCPTGNCSYEVHDSLAVCSECADISSLLELHQNYTITKNRTSYNNVPEPYATSSMNWTLPNGCFDDRTDIQYNETGPEGFMRTLTTFGDCSPLRLAARFPIANITAIVPCVDSEGLACPSQAKAQECSLHWCVNRYKSHVDQGTLFEEVLATSNVGRQTTLSNVGVEMDDTYYELSAPGDSPFPENFTQASPWINGTTDRYLVSQRISTFLTNFIAEDLTGFTYRYLDQDPRLSSQTDTSQAISRFRKSMSGDMRLDLTTVFETIALSMTTALRSQNKPDDGDFGLKSTQGKVTTLAPVLKIRWVWFSLPVALQVGALILLTQIRFSKSRHFIPIWKSSALAAAFFGGKGATDLGDKGGTKIVEMEEIASRVRTAGLFTGKGGY